MGTLADRYALDREIGRGGSAVVYRAQDLKLGRTVALKLVHAELVAAGGAERFAREIAVTAGLEHPHILALLDSGVADGVPFYVMPFVEGESLRARLRRDRVLPIDEAVRLAREVADALAHAHTHGIIHRDVKPENLLLADGHVRVADFGIARRAGASGTLTLPGMALGTLPYMSPEQIRGDEEIDGRSDVYALGCVLHELLAGAPPFLAPTVERIMTLHLLEPPEDVRAHRAEVPGELAAVVSRCLAKDPAGRYADAAALAKALTEIERRTATPPSGTAAHSSAPDDPTAHRGGRRRRIGIALLVAALVAVLVAVLGAGALALPSLRAWLTARSQAEAGAATPRWALFADFDGPADDPSIAPAIRDLAATAIEGAGRYARIPGDQIRGARALAEVPDTARLTTELARQLAYRKNVPMIIGGSVARLPGGGLAVSLRAIAPEDGRALASVAGELPVGDVVGSVGRLGESLLRQLPRGSGPTSPTKRPEVRTASFDAYRLLVEARARVEAGEHGPASVLAREAVRHDSLFASAWLTLWNAWRNTFSDSTRWAEARLVALADRLTPAERVLFDAYRKMGSSDVLQYWERYAEQEPLNAVAHNGVGVLRAGRRRLEDAERSFAQAVALSPLGAPTQLHLMNHALALFAMERADDGRAVALRTEGQIRDYLAIAEAIARRDWDRVAAEAATFRANAGYQSWRRANAAFAAASAMARQGHVQAALETLQQARPMVANVGGWEAELLQAMLVLHRAAGTRPAGPVPWRIEGTNPGRHLVAGLWSAARGDTMTAAGHLAVVTAARWDTTGMAGELELLQAAIADARGAPREVLRLLAAGSNEGGPWFPTVFLKRLLAADALLATSQPDSAIVMLELLANGTRLNFGERYLLGMPIAGAHERLGRAHLARGDTARAAEHLRTFLAMSADADPSLAPRLAEARTMLRRIGSTR